MADVENGRAGALSLPGPLRAELVKRIAKLHADYTGRGPYDVRLTMTDDGLLFTLVDIYTRAEQAMIEGGLTDEVLAWRSRMQQVMRDDIIAIVEDVAGLSVIGFVSANHIDPDRMYELVLVDGASSS